MQLPHAALLLSLASITFIASFPTVAHGQGNAERNDESSPAGQQAMIGTTTNLSIFSSRLATVTPAKVQEWAGDAATVEVVEGDPTEWVKLKITWPELETTLSTKSILKVGVAGYLAQFQGYAYSQLAGGEMDSWVFAVIKQIGRTNNIYAFTADRPMHKECIGLAQAIAQTEKGIFFVSSEILDTEFRELLGPDGSRDKDAEIPFFASASERRARSVELLAKRKLTPIELPMIVGDEAARLRSANSVARRFLCVAAVAMKADMKAEFDADAFIKKHGLGDSLTPDEHEFLANPTVESNSTMTWRYEAAWALLWSMNQTEEILFPDAQCDATLVIKAAMEDAGAILELETVRSTKEVLDQLDLLNLCHWITTDGRIKERSVEGLNGSVVYERIYALEWLTFDENADWDDVRTDS